MPGLSAIPFQLKALLKRARRRWKAEHEFLYFEWKQSRDSDLPFTYRLWCWWEGFHTYRAPLYRLDDPALAPLYVRDRDIYRNGTLNLPFTYLLNDKHAFWALVQTQTEHVAPLAGLINRGWFFPSQGAGSAGSLADVLPTWRGAFFIKPHRGSFGVDMDYLVCPEPGTSEAGITVNGEPISAEAFVKRLRGRPFVVSPAITQAAYSSTIQPATTNTIRLLTVFNEAEGRAHIVAATHNFGCSGGDTPADHTWHRGGVACPVNLETGELAAGVGFPRSRTVHTYDTHPETGAQLRGVVVPRWAEVRAEVERVSTALGFVPYVGWDVLMTDDNFRILEGNSRTALGLLQLQGPLLANPHFRALLQSRGMLPKRLRRD